jgi:ribosomal protein RSM22 (predicted rRNA methylase)
MRVHELDKDKYKQNGKIFNWCNFDSNFWRAPFFVSPARHGEAQDTSGTWKRKQI